MSLLLSVLCLLCSSATNPPLDFYSLVPGNWTQVVNNVSSSYAVVEISSELLENGTNLTTYAGEYGDLSLQIVVTSNSTARVRIIDSPIEPFEIVAHREAELICHADSTLTDGTHLIFTFYSTLSFELCVIPKGGSDMSTYGFFKRRTTQTTWFDFALPIGIALVLTFLLHRCLPRLFE
jgi:hypothetical protein